MKVIDYDKFMDYLNYLLDDDNDTKPETVIGKAYREGALHATEMIRRRAVVMAEEMPETIVRCKDCKHSVQNKYATAPNYNYFCAKTSTATHIDYHSENWFCADGERRESE